MECIEIDYKKEKQKLKKLIPRTYEILKDYNCYIAGGTITSLFTGKDINDIDVYFKDKTELFKVLYEHFSREYIVYVTKKAITFKITSQETVQFIFMNYYDKPEDIFDDFDFTICMGAFDIQKDKFVLHKDFLKDNVQKRLVVNTNTKFPIVTGTRILKYNMKGYEIDTLEMTKLMLAINKMNISTWKKLEEQLGGMYGENILELTKKDKETKFSINKVIEKLNCYYDEEHEFNRENEEMEKILNIEDEILRWQILLNYKLPYFIHKDKYYKDKYYIYSGEKHFVEVDKETIEENPKMFYKMKNIKNKLPITVTLYKYVHKVGDKYFSYYDETYEYKKGEIQKPRYDSNWLYLRTFKGLSSASYSNEWDKAILKCEVCISELESLELKGDIKVKELKVLDIKDISNNESELDLLPF